MSEKARVVVVDDHPLFRERLCQLINNEPDMEICGEADNAQEAIQIIRETSPNLAIIDITLKTSSGLELIKSIKALSIGVPVLVLSMHDESLYALRSMRAGAQGYVMKQEALDSVVSAIREIFAGRPYLSPAMSATVIAKVAYGAGEAKANPVDGLSDRELEILEFIGKGRDVREIAAALHLSPKTVETHRAHIKEKLALQNARQVARFAVQWLAGRPG